MRVSSGAHKPTRKADLIKAIKPHWKGLKSDLNEMSLKALRREYKKIYKQAMFNMIKK